MTDHRLLETGGVRLLETGDARLLEGSPPPLTPTVTNVTPTHGALAGGNTVIITGTALTGVTSVLFGATAATSFTVDSDTQITAVAPAHAGAQVHVTAS